MFICKVKSDSFETCQAPLVHLISQARVLLFPSPVDLPNLGMEHASPALAGGFFTTEPPAKPFHSWVLISAASRQLSPLLISMFYSIEPILPIRLFARYTDLGESKSKLTILVCIQCSDKVQLTLHMER